MSKTKGTTPEVGGFWPSDQNTVGIYRMSGEEGFSLSQDRKALKGFRKERKHKVYFKISE